MKIEKEMSVIDNNINNNINNVNNKINELETNINRMREEIGIIGAELHSDGAIIQNRMDTLENELQEIKTLLIRQQVNNLILLFKLYYYVIWIYYIIQPNQLIFEYE